MTTATKTPPPAPAAAPKAGAGILATKAAPGAPAKAGGATFTPARRDYLIRQLTSRKLKLKEQLKAIDDEIAGHKEALKAAK